MAVEVITLDSSSPLRAHSQLWNHNSVSKRVSSPIYISSRHFTKSLSPCPKSHPKQGSQATSISGDFITGIRPASPFTKAKIASEDGNGAEKLTHECECDKSGQCPVQSQSIGVENSSQRQQLSAGRWLESTNTSKRKSSETQGEYEVVSADECSPGDVKRPRIRQMFDNRSTYDSSIHGNGHAAKVGSELFETGQEEMPNQTHEAEADPVNSDVALNSVKAQQLEKWPLLHARRTSWTPPKDTAKDHKEQGDTNSESSPRLARFQTITSLFTFEGSANVANIKGTSLSKIKNNQEGKSKEGKSKEGKSKEGKSKEGKSKEGKSKEGKSKEGKSKEGKSTARATRQAKTKSGAKKPVTVTGIAIAQAQARAESLQNFGLEAVTASGKTANDTSSGLLANHGFKRENTKNRSTRKGIITPTRLPSPTRAIQSFRNQNLVFGTSSQLVLNDDASLISDLQVLTSVSRGGREQADDCKVSPRLTAQSCHGVATDYLWNTTRIGREPLLLSPGAPHRRLDDQGQPASMHQTSKSYGCQTPDTPPSLGDGQPPNTTPLNSCQRVQSPRSSLRGASYIYSDPILSAEPPSNQAAQFRCMHNASSTLKQTPKVATDQPVTDAVYGKEERQKTPRKKKELDGKSNAEAVTLKKVRGRPRKDTGAQSNAGVIASVPLTAARKRASKAAKPPSEDDWHNIDDIQDDDAPSPSPRRRLSPKMPAQLPMTAMAVNSTLAPDSAQDLNSKAIGKDEMATASRSEADEEKLEARHLAQQHLFANITRAIRSAPQTHSIQDPSWWDKILFYDPIVLEDLTEWLVQQNVRMPVRWPTKLSQVSTVELHDAYVTGSMQPVTAALVQRWCEDRSICCIWREGLNWRG